MLHLSSDGSFIRSSAGRPRMFVSLHTRHWARPFPLHCWNSGKNWPTQLLLLLLLLVVVVVIVLVVVVVVAVEVVW